MKIVSDDFEPGISYLIVGISLIIGAYLFVAFWLISILLFIPTLGWSWKLASYLTKRMYHYLEQYNESV